MKKALSVLLALLLVLSAPAGMAKQIEIYGDGSKKTMTLENQQGQTFTYYDIFNGATKREDTRDFDRFIRNVLTRNPSVDPKESQIFLWDVTFRNGLGSGSDPILKKYRGESLYDWFVNKDSGNQSRVERQAHGSPSELLFASSDAKSTELAIRSQMAKEAQKWDRHMTAKRIEKIKGLEELGFKGPSYFTINYAAVPYHWFVAYGSIFYDFNVFYLEDGKVADSAVGSETDINKLKGKRGFAHSAGQPAGGVSAWAVNTSRKKVTQSVSLSSTVSTTLSNSISQTQSTSRSYMVGLDTKISVKVPLCSVESTIKTSATSTFVASTTKGSSESKTETTTYNNTIGGIEVPPHTKVQVQMQEADATTSIEYDYPIGVSYKVAQYVIYDTDESFIGAVWGENKDAEHASAFQNIKERYEHRNSPGYDEVHASGYPVDWKKANIGSGWWPALTKYIPMSITGGKISGSGKALSLKVYDPMPASPISKMTSDVSALRLTKGTTANIYDMVTVQAYDSGTAEDPESLAFYGFDDDVHGNWVICDKDGTPAESSLITIDKDGTIKTKDETGVVYIKFMLDEDACPHVEDEKEDGEPVYGYSKNNDIDNDTLVEVTIADTSEAFAGNINISGDLACDLNDTIRTWPKVQIVDSNGAEVSAREYKLEWLVDGEPVKNGAYKATTPGEHKVKARYAGVESNEVTLTVNAGVKPTFVQMDKSMLDISKGNTAQIKLSLQPINADPGLVTWASGDESVATVDQNGKVTGVGTGVAIVTASVNGIVMADCDVYVGIPEAGDALDQGKLAIVKGKSFSLGRPGGAQGTWTSADESIARVTSKGKVMAKALGETTLTFKVSSAKSGAEFLGKSVEAGDEIVIPVAVRKKGEVVTKVTADSKKVTLAPGETYAIGQTLKPDKALDKEVYYVSSKNAVASVDAQGVVTAKAKGKATIYVVSASGKRAKVTVTVAEGLTGIELNAKKKKLSLGEAFILMATPVPAGTENFVPVFKSNKPNIVSVDENGLLTALKKGKATITVTSADGGKIKAKCVVTVK